MDLPQPLVRKANHIEWFRFHPEDTQNRIFDVIVNQMKVFEWVDEDGNPCEYMYLPSKDGGIYKALLPKTNFIEVKAYKDHENEKKDKSFNPFSTDAIIGVLQKRLYKRIDMIPTRMVGNIAMDFQEKYQKPFPLFGAFKCQKSRISTIHHYISNLKKYWWIFFDEHITREIDIFNQYYNKRMYSRWWRSEKSRPKYDDNMPGVTQKDIEKWNDILKKLITYLEEKYPPA